MAQKDYDELLYLFPPKDRELVAWWMTARAGFMAMFGAFAEKPEIKRDYEAILKRHHLEGLESQPQARSLQEAARRAKELFDKVDRAQLLGDVVRFFDEHLEGRLTMPRGELSDLQVSGDTAKGRIGGKPVEFSRVGSRWYAELPVE